MECCDISPQINLEKIQDDYSESFQYLCWSLKNSFLKCDKAGGFACSCLLLVIEKRLEGNVLSLMVQQRYMLSNGPVIMQKGAGLSLLKRDPMKEQLLYRQKDPNRQVAREKLLTVHEREALPQTM